MKKRILKSVLSFLMCSILLLTTVGCGQKSQKDNGTVGATTGDTTYPVTITDDVGHKVSIEKEPTKIVSLSPANTEILFSLGVGDKVVGRTDYCNYPKEAGSIPTIGDYNNPNLEKIISLAPEIVLAGDLISEDVCKQIEATGAKVLVYTPMSVDAIETTMINTGKIVNANDKAKTETEAMTKKYEEIKGKASQVNVQKSIFIDIGQYYSAGDDSLLGNMLKDINAKNIASDAGTAWPQLSVEQIIAKNPDVYVSFFTKPDEIKKVPGFDQVNAIKNNGIVYYEMLSPDSDLIQRPGPRIVDGLALLAAAVYPEQFK
ncbi:MAG: ABC transporter substrate-binding protein [Eubacterium sp.]